jgi:hypothetical protein
MPVKGNGMDQCGPARLCMQPERRHAEAAPPILGLPEIGTQ